MISYDIQHTPVFLQSTKNFHTIQKKNNGNKNNKTFPIKMKEDVGMSKPKKHANKVRWLT